MATYSIKVLKEGRTITRKQITQGLLRTEAVVIKAGPDQAYVLSDALLENKAPTKIQTRRVGKNLHVALGDSSVASPDLIIDGYFDFPPAPLLGTLGDGTTAVYDMSLIAGLAQDTGVPTAAASTSAGVESALADPKPYAGMSGGQIAAALGFGALALGGGGGGGGSDAAAPTAAQTAQAKINAYANDNAQPAPGVADYAAIGVSGVTVNNLSAINAAIDALNSSNVDSATKVQVLVDAYSKILAEANGSAADATPGNNPTPAQYAAIGANIGAAASNSENLALLGDVIGNKTTTDVDTIAEINALADTVNSVMVAAAGGAAPSMAQLSLIGIAGVIPDNLAAVQRAIAATVDSGTGVDTVAELQAIVGTAISLTTVVNYAASSVNAAPTLADYTQLGITGVTTTNLAAINSAVDALGTTDVNSAVKVQGVVDAYNKILVEANGTAVDTSPSVNPFASDYAALGANAGLAASNTYALSLLNDIVGSLNTAAVDSVAEINGLSVLVDKFMNTAAGTGTGLTLADFSTIGIATAGTGAVTNINLGAVNEAIAQVGGQNRIDTLTELQTLVSAVATVVTYADDNSQAVPTLTAYTNAGLTGVTAINVAAINSAIDANAVTSVDTKAETQTIVDAYNVILAEANGAVADATPGVNPVVTQYAAIGAQIGNAATDTENLGLLNDALGNLNTVNVDTVAEINAMAATVDKVMNLATLTSGSAIPTGAPSMAELGALGLSTTLADSAAEQTAVWQAIIDSADSGMGVDTGAELQAIVSTAISLVAVGNYAASNANAAPTLADYTQLGTTGVTNTNLSAINSAVDALGTVDVNSAVKVQAVVDAYNKILVEANGTAVDASPGINPLAGDYAAIGANVGLASSNASALSLLDDIVGGLNATAVDSVAEINSLSVVVDKLMNTAAGTQADLTVEDFARIGLTPTGTVTSINLNAVKESIAQAGGQDRIDTLAELQTVIASVSAAISLTAIGNYAASNASAVPTLADYTQLGITGVTGTNLVAINSAVDALGTTDVNSAVKVQAVVDAYNKILVEANGTAVDASPSVNPLASDYAAIGANVGLAASSGSALSLLDSIVGGLSTTAVDTVAEINGLSLVVDKLMNTAAGTQAGLTVEDFGKIGVATAGTGAVTSINLSAVNEAIAQAGGQDRIDTLAELQTLVSAVATIVTYADNSSQAIPTLSDYTNAGLTGVTTVNLAAINSSIDANVVTSVDTKAETQTIIDAYNVILAEANGVATDATPGVNPTGAQYAAIGAQIGNAATDTENLGLLNDALGNLGTVNVDTVAEINALAATVGKVMSFAALSSGSAIPIGAPSMAELGALGLSTTLVDTAAEQTAVWQAIIDSADSGTGVATTLQLQALINAHAS